MHIVAIVLWTLLWALVGLCVLIIALVLLVSVAPARMAAHVEARTLQLRLRRLTLSTMWGAVAAGRDPAAARPWYLRLLGAHVVRWGGKVEGAAEREAEKEPEPDAPTARATPRERGKRIRRVRRRREKADGLLWRELWRRGLLQAWAGPALRALGQLLRAPRWERAEGRVTFGTGDPACTGMVYGLAYAAAGPLLARPGVALVIDPDFMDARADGAVEVGLSLRPIQVVAVAARLLWRGPTWRTYKAYRAAKRRSKRANVGAFQ
jgi:hypothetical protein